MVGMCLPAEERSIVRERKKINELSKQTLVTILFFFNPGLRTGRH